MNGTLRRIATTLAAGLLLASCSGDASDSGPDPIPNGTEAAGDPSESTSPSAPSEPAWTSKYTDRQIATYEAALARWTEYETKAEPIWAEGKATPEARRLLQEYFPSPLWQDLYRKLETYEQVEVQVLRAPEVLWSRPSRIARDSVLIRQCVDLTTQQTTQFGEPVPFPRPFRKPVIRVINVGQPKNNPWLIYEERSPTVDNFVRCQARPS